MKKHAFKGLVLFLALTATLILTLSGFAQEKAKPEAPAKEVAIARAVVATGVENQEPTGAAEAFSASTEKVYCFVEATHISKDTEVSFVWSYGGKEVRKITLPLKSSPKWRTWAYKSLGGQKGDWKVEVKDAGGKVLKEVKFKVE